MKFKQTLVSRLLAQGASALNFPSGGNPNNRLQDHWRSEEVHGYRSRRLPPGARVERAPEEPSRRTWEQTAAVEVISTIDEGRPTEHPHVGNGFQLALCYVGWLATQESAVLGPDPIVFAPWSVLLDRDEPCDSCQDTPHEATLPGQARGQARATPITGLTLLAVCCYIGAAARVNPPLVVVLCSLFCSMPYHKSIGRMTRGFCNL